MKHKFIAIFVCLIIVVSLGAPIQVNAGDEKVITQVITIDTHGNTKAYLNGLKPVLARNKELAPKANFRVYKAGFAGSDTGLIHVVIEYPSMAYLEEVGKKIESDPELTKGIMSLKKTGRTIESDSILFDVTP